ncbi:MAG: hypothetical protein GC152_15950 [Alphaproteobacteria bacterium]|nr:hypothetical protein [Alphaproteobacteria bacterium]
MTPLPFRHGWVAILLLLPLVGLAFWPNYISRITTAPIAFHAHGVTATLWIALVAAQILSIHHASPKLHRTLGKLSFVLMPLFMAGGVMILQSMAVGFATNRDPFVSLLGARLGTFDVIAGAGFGFFYLMALLTRRSPQLHARYMTATVLFLIGPIIGRLMPGFVPGLGISGIEELSKFGLTIHAGNAIAAAIALYLVARAPRHGAPFLIAAALIGLQSAAYKFVGPLAWWEAVFVRIGEVPGTLAICFAFAAGIAIVFVGWTAPRRSQARLMAS